MIHLRMIAPVDPADAAIDLLQRCTSATNAIVRHGGFQRVHDGGDPGVRRRRRPAGDRRLLRRRRAARRCCGDALGDYSDCASFRGSALQPALNMVSLLVAATAMLAIQRSVYVRRRHRADLGLPPLAGGDSG